jgi:GR25 family glycosyltransferase involved in LPS biosynthesis
MSSVPPAICISLDRRPDRWNHIKASADAAGLPLERLVAVDAKTFDAVHHPAVSVGTAHNIQEGVRRSHYEIDAAGAIGCSLSHFAAWRRITDEKLDAMIIFEDDVEIPVDIKERLEYVMANLPPNWDMVTFYMTQFRGGRAACKPVGNGSEWWSCRSQMGAHAYMLSRRGAEKLLTRAYPIELHVDAYMAYMARLGEITILRHPLIDIEPDDFGTDIGHGSTGILNVPTNMEKRGYVVLTVKEIIGLMGMAAVAGGLIAVASWRSAPK